MTVCVRSAVRRLVVSLGLVVCVSGPSRAEDVFAQYCEPCPPPTACPPCYDVGDMMAAPPAQSQPSKGQPAESQPQAVDTPQAAPNNTPNIDFSATSSAGALASANTSPRNFAPNMIGDFFQGGATIFNSLGSGFSATATPTDIAGRFRVQDNNSALPQDRVYFDYNFFRGAQLSAAGTDVNRFTIGFEKTFNDGLSSIEVGLPMASTISSSSENGVVEGSNYELGNLAITFKTILDQTRDTTWAAGMAVSVPIGDDIVNFDGMGGINYEIVNESVHLIPYVAYRYAPRDSNYFAHAFLTTDVTLNGNTVFVPGGGGGIYNDQTLITLDAAIGEWVYRSNCCQSRLSGLAWSAELHYTAGVSSADAVPLDTLGVTNLGTDDLSVLNGVIGGHANFACGTTVTAAYAVPITNEDRPFESEFRFFINKNY